DLALTAGELEGQALLEQALQRPVGGEHGGRGAFVLVASLGKDGLQDERLLVPEGGHAVTGVLEGQRGMDQPDGLLERRQGTAGEDVLGHRAREGAGELEALLDGRAHGGLRDVLSQRVDGTRPLGPGTTILGVLHRLVGAGGDLAGLAVAGVADGAVDADPCPHGEPAAMPLDLMRLGEEEGQHDLLDAVGDRDLEDAAGAAAHGPVADGDHRDDGADLLAPGHLVQGAQRGGHDVAPRGEAHHGVQVAHAEGGHRPGLLGAQQLLERHRAAGALLPPGHAGVSSFSAVTYRATCEAPSCHCPGTLWRNPQGPGASPLFSARPIWAMIPWLPLTPGGPTLRPPQGPDPRAPRAGGAGPAVRTTKAP